MSTLTLVRTGISHSTRVVRPVPAARPSRQPARPARRPRPVWCERSYEADLHGSRLTARGRVVVAAVWCLLAAAAGTAIVRPGLAADPAPAGTATVVVRPGDTLWGVARTIDATADPRATIDAIVELNGLRSGTDIDPGDVLLVPRAG